MTAGNAVRGGADPSAVPAGRSAVPALAAERFGKGRGGRSGGTGGAGAAGAWRGAAPRPPALGPPSTGRAGAAVPGSRPSRGSRRASPLERTARRRERGAAALVRRGALLTLEAAALRKHRVGWVGSALVLGPFVHVPFSPSVVSGSIFNGSWVTTVSLCEELCWSLGKSCRNASREILGLSK